MIVKNKKEQFENYINYLKRKEKEKINENSLISNEIKLLENENLNKNKEVNILKKEIKKNYMNTKLLHNNINEIKSNFFFGCLLNINEKNTKINFSEFSINVNYENENLNFNFDKIFTKKNEIFLKMINNIEICLKEGKNLIYFSFGLKDKKEENNLKELIDNFINYVFSKEISLYYKLIGIKDNNSILINEQLIEVNQIKNDYKLITDITFLNSNQNIIINQFLFHSKFNTNGNFIFIDLPFIENENIFSLIKILGLLINKKTSRNQINFKESKLTSFLKGFIDLNSKDFIYLITHLNDNEDLLKNNINILKFLQNYNIIF